MRQKGIAPRRAAIEAGEDEYEGQPCASCGTTERYARSGNCKFCAKSQWPLDTQIAFAMWEAAERPCKWQDLSEEEKEEWIVMARAARERLFAKIRHAVGHLNDT